MKINKIKNQFGVTAIEYALLMVLIAVGIILSAQTAGYKLSDTFCSISFSLGGKSCAGTTNPADLSLADKLQLSLIDKLDLNDIDVSQGGTGHWVNGPWQPDDAVFNATRAYYMEHIATALEQLNSDEDPITNVFGVYARDGTPITDYASALVGFQSGSDWRNYDNTTISGMSSTISLPNPSGENGYIEVTTKSGVVYKINKNGNVSEQPHK